TPSSPRIVSVSLDDALPILLILLAFAVAYYTTMTVLHAAWAFLIVTGFYLLLALIAALLGIRSLKKIRAPRNTIDTVSQIPGAFNYGDTDGGTDGGTDGDTIGDRVGDTAALRARGRGRHR